MQHSVERRFSADHPTAAGHFPGNPIIPGALLLDEVVHAIREASEPAGERCEVRAAKFLTPVRPGDRVRICWSAGRGDDIRFECRVIGSERVALTGSVRFAAATG